MRWKLRGRPHRLLQRPLFGARGSRAPKTEDGILETLTSKDGDHTLTIRRTADFFRYVEEAQLTEPDRDGFGSYRYWAEVHVSGLYATAEEAKRAALDETPWLRGPDR